MEVWQQLIECFTEAQLREVVVPESEGLDMSKICISGQGLQSGPIGVLFVVGEDKIPI